VQFFNKNMFFFFVKHTSLLQHQCCNCRHINIIVLGLATHLATTSFLSSYIILIFLKFSILKQFYEPSWPVPGLTESSCSISFAANMNWKDWILVSTFLKKMSVHVDNVCMCVCMYVCMSVCSWWPMKQNIFQNYNYNDK
jgi:hypothetical protein